MCQIIEKGYSLYFDRDACTIYDKQDKSFEIVKVKMKESKHFPIQWRYTNDVAMKIQVAKSWFDTKCSGTLIFMG